MPRIKIDGREIELPYDKKGMKKAKAFEKKGAKVTYKKGHGKK